METPSKAHCRPTFQVRINWTDCTAHAYSQVYSTLFVMSDTELLTSYYIRCDVTLHEWMMGRRDDEHALYECLMHASIHNPQICTKCFHYFLLFVLDDDA